MVRFDFIEITQQRLSIIRLIQLAGCQRYVETSEIDEAGLEQPINKTLLNQNIIDHGKEQLV